LMKDISEDLDYLPYFPWLNSQNVKLLTISCLTRKANKSIFYFFCNQSLFFIIS
jgi:hypothetical protein